jgi:hypothetical protein
MSNNNPTKIIQLGNNQNLSRYFTNVNQRKNHTRYALEMKKIYISNILDYGKDVSIDIPILGDLLGRMFFEITLPNINLSEDILKNMNETKYNEYINYKNNKLNNLQIEIDYWTTFYTNLYNYSEIQIDIYLEIKKLLKITNFSLSYIQNKILILINKYTNLYDYQLLIEKNILDNINISGYILDTDFFNNFNYSETNNLITTILTNIELRYSNIQFYLSYYNSNITYYKNKYDQLNNKKLFYKWIEYFSHYYFDFFELNINGFSIDRYTNDFLHLYQSKYVHIDYLSNYNDMIGNTIVDGNNYIYNETTNIKKVYIPLLFFNCDNDEATDYIPLVAIPNSNIKLFSKINELSNLIYFIDWETEYYNELSIDIPKKNHTINNNDTIDKYNFGDYNYISVEYLYPEQIYRYTFSSINPELFKLKYPDLSTSDITALFNKYGIDDNGNKIITLNEYIYMKNNIKNDDEFDDDIKLLLLDYHYFVDYNYLLNIIPKPNISLIVEYGFIDDVEKLQFTKNNLEYFVETHHEIVFNISKDSYFDSLNDISGLIKEIFYFYRPFLYKNGYTKYSKSNYAKFTDFDILDGELLDNVEINISNQYNIVEYIKPSDNFNKVSQYELLNSNLPDGVYYKSLSLIPSTKSQPSGSFNANSLKGQNIVLEFDTTKFNNYINNINNPDELSIEFKILYTKYNIFHINNGECELLFYS